MAEEFDLQWGLDLDFEEDEQKPRRERGPPRSRRTRREYVQAQKDQLEADWGGFGDGEDGSWDRFYAEKGVNFFKDRHNLRKFFPELMPESVRADPTRHHPPLQVSARVNRHESRPPSEEDLQGMVVVVECGCGVGNACFPLLRANRSLFLYSFDFSRVAVSLLRSSDEYDPKRVHAFVGDLTRPGDVSGVVGCSKADFVTMVWVLSAIPPEHMPAAVGEAAAVLKKGGLVLFRDYAVGDLAQTRKSVPAEPGFFRRGDGTIAYFFDERGLRQLFEAGGFRTVELTHVERVIENRKEALQMHRRWLQAKFELV